MKRSRLEIYFDVLHVIESGVDKPTRIMYRTNLSWVVLSDILENLLNHSFIEMRNDSGRKRYYISDKGTRALSSFRKSIEGFPVVEISGGRRG